MKRNFSKPMRRRLLRGRWRIKQETLRKVSKWMVNQKRKRKARKIKRRAGSGARRPEPRKRRPGSSLVLKRVDLATGISNLKPTQLFEGQEHTYKQEYVQASVKLREENKHVEFMQSFKLLTLELKKLIQI